MRLYLKLTVQTRLVISHRQTQWWRQGLHAALQLYIHTSTSTPELPYRQGGHWRAAKNEVHVISTAAEGRDEQTTWRGVGRHFYPSSWPTSNSLPGKSGESLKKYGLLCPTNMGKNMPPFTRCVISNKSFNFIIA